MLAQEYIDAGFPVSLHIDQPIIEKAERDVREAYILPIIGTSQECPVVRAAVMNLSFMLMSQRNIFVTRSGAKEKMTANSRGADKWATLQEMAQTCHMKLQAVRNLEGANPKAYVQDICGIYLKTNFFYL